MIGGKAVRADSRSHRRTSLEGEIIMERDPVCGMRIKKEEAAGSSDYNGTVYYFCSPGCKKSFDENPEKYAAHDENPHGEHHH